MRNNITSAPSRRIVWFAMSRLLCLLFFLLPLHAAQAVEVLTSIRPLALIAQVVAGDKVAVQQLVPNGTSSHDYQLKPSDRLRLVRADILLWTGPANEAFLARSVAASKAKILTAQKLPDIRLLAHRRLDGETVVAGSVDPHLWLDPDNAVVIARALADVLALRDPASAGTYRKNAAEFATRIALLKAKQAPRFQGLPSRSFIAYHDAYQYLEPVLGLNYRGSLVHGGEGKPSAKHFLLVSQKIRQENISCLLGEPGFDEALARNVFAGNKVVLVSVDEQFAAAPSSAEGYEAGLSLMADGIYHCLSGTELSVK
ncbi:MAG: metal ABC transporter solute-binding protein, Zn/Mn family [Moraxellaceae bacterium]